MTSSVATFDEWQEVRASRLVARTASIIGIIGISRAVTRGFRSCISDDFLFILCVDSKQRSSECEYLAKRCENRRINDSSGRCEESPRYQNYSEHDEQRSEQDLTHRLLK